MNSDSEFICEEALNLANEIVKIQTNKNLSNLEEEVFKGSWEDKDYKQIAHIQGYSLGHITEVGSGLWNKLSQALGESISKKTFRQPLRKEWDKRRSHNAVSPALFVKPQSIESTQQEIDLYVERPPIEEHCYSEILKPGCLLRIKAPRQTGKTELMSKVIHYAAQQGHRTVVLNLRDAIQSDFSNLDKYLQWFCTIIAHRFEWSTTVEEHWHKSIGNSKIKCRSYFEKYLLPLEQPLTLALDEVDRIFPYREIASEFLGMLRTWHEDAKTRPLWQQLRLILLHSEIYTEVDINQSPFNAGYEMTLKDFTQEQVFDLALLYGLNLNSAEVARLMKMVGGHPYLVGKALKQMVGQDATVEEVLQTSHTAWGIYSRHLERHWKNLQSNLELATTFDRIVQADSPVEYNSQLNPSMVVKLNDLGLVKLSNSSLMPRYELYRQYFRNRLLNNL